MAPLQLNSRHDFWYPGFLVKIPTEKRLSSPEVSDGSNEIIFTTNIKQVKVPSGNINFVESEPGSTLFGKILTKDRTFCGAEAESGLVSGTLLEHCWNTAMVQPKEHWMFCFKQEVQLRD